MKTLRIFLAIFLASIALAGAARTPGDRVGVTITPLSYDFGNVNADADPVVRQFQITNNGSTAVAILSARASCGCTEPRYDRRPILPGQTATVTLTFMPAGQRGEVDKEVTLRLKNASGTSEKVHLRLHGVVLP